jgi:two-component system sensor histidine kinase DesK
VDGNFVGQLLGPAEAARLRVSGRQRWILGALASQAFVVSAYVAILTSGLTPLAIAGYIALLLAFSATYIFVAGRFIVSTMWHRVLVVAGLLLLTLPQFAVLGVDASSLWIFVAVAGGILFPGRVAMAVAVVLAAVMLVLDAVVGEPLSWELALTLIALTAFMVGFAGNVRLNIELRRTREQLAVAAVAAERERIGRDLHDILGHSLTAIAVKAGLARRLLDRDPAAAAAEIGDVEQLAREALKDVRATASGYREVSLAGELSVAASVLRAAGIRAELPSAVDGVDPADREIFGYVVREAVTNVVRHSGARTCRIILGERSIEIRDDGATGARTTADDQGSGLRGLARRVAARGGTMSAGPQPGAGFLLSVTMPPVGSVPTPTAP